MDGHVMDFAYSPFIVPVAGCFVGAVAIICGFAAQDSSRKLKSQERLALLARGVPIAEIEQLFRASEPSPFAAKSPYRSLGTARRTAVVLISCAIGIMVFFGALSVILHEHDVLSGAAIGLIPLSIGLGFVVDYQLQKRELARFGLEVDSKI